MLPQNKLPPTTSSVMQAEEIIDIPNEKEIIKIILGMKRKAFTSLRRERQWQLLTALMYITGGRVSEVLALRIKSFNPDKEGKYSVVSINTLKRYKRRREIYEEDGVKYKGDFIDVVRKKIIRQVLINLKRDAWVVNLLYDYVEDFPEDLLFTYEHGGDRLLSRKYAWKAVKERTGYRNHFFRHARATNLVREFGLNDQELTLVMGWANSAMASTYVHLNWQALTNKL